MEDQTKIATYMAQGKIILDKKDNNLLQTLKDGGLYIFTEEHLNGWKLPETWLSARVYIIDNTNIVFDTTEAAHIVFTHYPDINIFINYRRKTFYTKGPNPVMKTVYVYSARSRGFNLTEGTIFNGHPTAAGASIVKEDGLMLPFLLDPTK